MKYKTNVDDICLKNTFIDGTKEMNINHEIYQFFIICLFTVFSLNTDFT